MCKHLYSCFVLYLTVWGVEPVVTHEKSWLESTGVASVHFHSCCWGQTTGLSVRITAVYRQEKNTAHDVPTSLIVGTVTLAAGCLSRHTSRLGDTVSLGKSLWHSVQQWLQALSCISGNEGFALFCQGKCYGQQTHTFLLLLSPLR